MSFSNRALPLFLVAPLVALLGACVESRHPASDEKTSKIDEQLIGTWQHDSDDQPMVWTFSKRVGTKNALEVEIKDANGSGKAMLFTTTIKAKHYMSVKDLDKEAQKDRKGAYDIYQYRFVDTNTVEVRGMDGDALKKAITAKKLAGTIDQEGAPIITASRDAIVDYLETHADECYPVKTDYMLTFKLRK